MSDFQYINDCVDVIDHIIWQVDSWRILDIGLVGCSYKLSSVNGRTKRMSGGSSENHLKTGGEQLEFKNRLQVSSGTLVVSESCAEHFQELKLRRKYRYILYKIGEEAIEGWLFVLHCVSLCFIAFHWIVDAVGDRKKVSSPSIVHPYSHSLYSREICLFHWNDDCS